VFGLLVAKRLDGWTTLFLASTVLTSVTGFLFPFSRFLPSHGVGILSLLALAIAIFARYGRHLSGLWRRTYAITAVIALYLNVFVLIVQLFQKVPALKAIAPTQSEAPFKGHTACRSGAFRRAWWFCGDQVPERAARHGLIGPLTCSPRPAGQLNKLANGLGRTDLVRPGHRATG